MSSALHQHPGRYTLADWRDLEEDQGWRTELIGGDVVVSPPPGSGHQRAEIELAFVLRGAVRAAGRSDLEVLTGVGVEVDDSHALIPDVAIVAAGLEVAAYTPDQVRLVVEVVSPTSTRRDRLVKPAVFAAVGVPFYWRVEPQAPGGLAVVCARLVDGHYVETETVAGSTPVTVTTAPVQVTLTAARLG